MPAAVAAKVRTIAGGMAAVLLATGCATVPPAQRSTGETAADRRALCARFTGPSTADAAIEAGESDAPPAAALARLPYSPRAIETARIIGVLPELVRLSAVPEGAPGGPDVQAQLDRLQVHQQLLARIALASLEVSSVLAELDCEGERSDQLRDRLQRVEDQRLRALTLNGIVVGALTAIVGGALSLASRANAADVAAIVGGSTEAGIGLSTLSDGAPAQLDHPRNLLGEVWHGRAGAGIFPASVWRYLDAAPGPGLPGMTNRELLIEQWRQPERLGERGSELEARRAALMFGAGGLYTLGDLQARDAILDLLEARVALLNQDIADLLREVVLRGAGPDGLRAR